MTVSEIALFSIIYNNMTHIVERFITILITLVYSCLQGLSMVDPCNKLYNVGLLHNLPIYKTCQIVG